MLISTSVLITWSSFLTSLLTTQFCDFVPSLPASLISTLGSSHGPHSEDSQLRGALFRMPQHSVPGMNAPQRPSTAPPPPSHSVTAHPYTHSVGNVAHIPYLPPTLSASSEVPPSDSCSLTSYICLSNAPSLLSPVPISDGSYYLFPDSYSNCLGSTLWDGACKTQPLLSCQTHCLEHR